MTALPKIYSCLGREPHEILKMEEYPFLSVYRVIEFYVTNGPVRAKFLDIHEKDGRRRFDDPAWTWQQCRWCVKSILADMARDERIAFTIRYLQIPESGDPNIRREAEYLHSAENIARTLNVSTRSVRRWLHDAVDRIEEKALEAGLIAEKREPDAWRSE